MVAVDDSEDTAELGGALLSVSYLRLPRGESDHVWAGDAEEEEEEPTSAYGVVAALPGRTMLLDAASWEPLAADLLVSPSSGFSLDGSLEISGGCVICGCDEMGEYREDGMRQGIGWMLRAAAFQPIVRIWWLGVASAFDVLEAEAAEHAEAVAAAGGCSVLPTKPPQRDSPLGKALTAELTTPAAAAPAAKGPSSHRGPKANQPVTFHRKIASSGYGKAPILKLHSGGPSTQAAAAARAAANAGIGRGAPLELSLIHI